MIAFHIIDNLSDPAHASLFDAIFALYETTFPENERHDYQALRDNLDRAHLDLPFRNLWLVAVDETEQVLGALGADIHTPSVAGFCDRMAVMSYLFVTPAARGQRLGRRLEQTLIGHVGGLGARRILMTCDIENPDLMLAQGLTRADWDESLRIAGVTPVQRMKFWRDSMGYRGTDFPYVLQVMRTGVQPTRALQLHVKMLVEGVPQTINHVPADLMRDAACLINSRNAFSHIPAEYRDHPALATMWSWPEKNPLARVSPHLSDEFMNFEEKLG